MKEAELPTPRIEVQAEKQEQKRLELIGRIKPHQGHVCFEYNIATGEIQEAQFMEQTVNYAEFVQTRTIQKKIMVKQGCLYVAALNKTNAEKKFKKMIGTA